MRAWGFKKKFVLLLLVFMVIPTCAISAWMYKQVTDTWIEQEYNNQSNELGTILKTTELRLEDLEQIIYDFYQEEDIVTIMKQPPEDRIPLDYVEMTNYLRGDSERKRICRFRLSFLQKWRSVFSGYEPLQGAMRLCIGSIPSGKKRLKRITGR